MKQMIIKIIIGLFLITAILFFLYSCYWVAKTVSYQIFYKDMVKTTISEMVKKEALNN